MAGTGALPAGRGDLAGTEGPAESRRQRAGTGSSPRLLPRGCSGSGRALRAQTPREGQRARGKLQGNCRNSVLQPPAALPRLAVAFSPSHAVTGSRLPFLPYLARARADPVTAFPRSAADREASPGAPRALPPGSVAGLAARFRFFLLSSRAEQDFKGTGASGREGLAGEARLGCSIPPRAGKGFPVPSDNRGAAAG